VVKYSPFAFQVNYEGWYNSVPFARINSLLKLVCSLLFAAYLGLQDQQTKDETPTLIQNYSLMPASRSAKITNPLIMIVNNGFIKMQLLPHCDTRLEDHK
jgi:hypothetical protein